MNYFKYAVWAVVAFFLFRLWGAKKRGMSTPDALRSQIPFVGDFLARAAEHPPTVMSGASTAAVDPSAQAPGWSIDTPSNGLVSFSPTSIMHPPPSRFLPDNTPHPLVLQSFDAGSFVEKIKAPPAQPLASFDWQQGGGATPAAAPPTPLARQQFRWSGLAGTPAGNAKGLFG